MVEGRRVAAFWYAIGTFASVCDSFSFKTFPFDTLKCDVIFESEDPTYEVQYSILNFEIDTSAKDSFIGDTDIWSFVGMNATREPWNQYADGVYFWRMKFTVCFRRKYNYYVGNIFIPTNALFILQISALIMPPETPDRPALSTSIVVAFALILSMVFESIPRTSEMVYLVVMVETKMVCSIATTIYMLAANAASKYSPAQRIPWKPLGLTAIQIADLCTGIVLGTIVVTCDSLLFFLLFDDKNI